VSGWLPVQVLAAAAKKKSGNTSSGLLYSVSKLAATDVVQARLPPPHPPTPPPSPPPLPSLPTPCFLAFIAHRARRHLWRDKTSRVPWEIAASSAPWPSSQSIRTS
jgi:hypothetical protein